MPKKKTKAGSMDDDVAARIKKRKKALRDAMGIKKKKKK